MEDKYTQLRIRRSTNQKLRLCGALMNRKLIDLIDEFATDELKRRGQLSHIASIKGYADVTTEIELGV